MNAFHWIAGEWTGTPAVDSIDSATGLAIGRFTTTASLKPTPPLPQPDTQETVTVLVQIGKRVEKLPIGSIPYRADRTAFHTAGATASLRPSFARSNWPLRMRCVNSIPEIVIAALLNRLNPSITFVLDSM
jgi:hypothetical protein